MKKKLVSLVAGLVVSTMILGGCSSEISNDYVTISQYKGLEVEKATPAEVTDEDVESYISSMCEANSTSTVVTDRVAQDGDTVTIDYEGKMDGVAFDGGSAVDAPLTLGSNSFIDGFEEGIVGHGIGETFDLDLVFPDPYPNNPDFAGKPVVFTVTVKGITQVDVPELTDELVKTTLSETSQTVEEYKQEVRDFLESNNESAARNTLKSNAWNALMDNTQVTKYPEDELKAMIDTIQQQMEQNAAYYGVEFEEYRDTYLEMDEEAYNSEITQSAKDRLKEELVADLVIEKAKIDVSEEALKKKYEEYASQTGYSSAEELKEVMESYGSMDDLEEMAKIDIVQDWLADNCKQVEKSDSEGSK